MGEPQEFCVLWRCPESGSSFIHLLFCPASLKLVSEISEPDLAAPPRPSWMQQSWVSSAPKGQVSEPRPL